MISRTKIQLKDKFDTELFIKTVEKFPEIWDTNHQAYLNAKRRERAWEKICATLVSDWDVHKDKHKILYELKKKWTHIRDYCRKRTLTEKNSTDNADQYRKRYIYDHLLHFLKPIIAPGQDDESTEQEVYVTEGDSADQFRERSPSADRSQDPSLTQTPKRIKTEHSYSDINFVLTDLGPHHNPTTASPEPDVSVRDVSVSFDNPLHLEPRAEAQDKTDDDSKFLLSFRGYMRKMTDEQKVEFQIGMLKLVKKTLWEGS
ncbi:uncharacterized protein LOC121726191 [Aricia agestis]|uniref:uncharacterized protein LOC121726191 n=1 Tax=Aricia agestis TaxID=91739 RepID=UPI001C20491A|nr:uncharacterized protein LOC121726191 [Aricia agestis]